MSEKMTLQPPLFASILCSESEQKIIKELKSITPFLNQAKINLTGNAKELWEAGIENLRQQRDNLIVVRSKLNLSSTKINNII